MNFPFYLVNKDKEPVKIKDKKQLEGLTEELRHCPGMWDKDWAFDIISYGPKEQPKKRGRKKKVEDGDSKGLSDGSVKVSEDNRGDRDSRGCDS
jgi:hypothetical protein